MKKYVVYGIIGLNLIISGTLIASLPQSEFEKTVIATLVQELEKNLGTLKEEQKKEVATTFLEEMVASLAAAIEKSEVERVERLIDLHAFDEKQRKELLEKSRKVAAERAQNITLLKSPWDLAKVATGAVLTVGGGLAFNTASNWTTTKTYEKVIATAGCIAGLLTLPGMYLMIQGLTCFTAEELYEKADKIEGLIKAVPLS